MITFTFTLERYISLKFKDFEITEEQFDAAVVGLGFRSRLAGEQWSDYQELAFMYLPYADLATALLGSDIVAEATAALTPSVGEVTEDAPSWDGEAQGSDVEICETCDEPADDCSCEYCDDCGELVDECECEEGDEEEDEQS